jgi:preprotein translocase subunit YajC
VYLNFLLQDSAALQPFVGMLPILAMVGIFYFLLFLPMQKQKKAQQKMLTELANGQIVVTTGGIIGSIVAINPDDTLILRVKPDNIKIQVARSAVSGMVTEEQKK